MRIVVDAMGSDHAPAPDVAGAVMAAQESGIEIILVGPEEIVKAELSKHNLAGAHLSVRHAAEVVKMEEHTSAVRTKRDSSMVVAMEMLRHGEADAFVSAGNSGAVMAAALFHLGRLKGIIRPAITAIYPTVRGRCVVLDVGANTDCRPEYLYQFALMGNAYAECVLGISKPRVGILSNGEEEGKGSTLVREAYALLKQGTFNFVGNVEGKDLPLGLADVVVTDGFTGNVVIKLSEGLIMAVAKMLKRALTGGLLPKIGALLMIPGLLLCLPGGLLVTPGLRQMVRKLNPDEVGGAPLLGVRGPVIIGHGRSNAKAIKNAIYAAKQAAEADVLAAIQRGLNGVNPVPSEHAEAGQKTDVES
jgi:glycerol-3-phosphate acyltransferase PlsX